MNREFIMITGATGFMMKYLYNYLILIISCFFYFFTLAPTVIGGDSSAFCLRVHNFALHFGDPNDHPLHTVIGKIFSLLPFELAFDLNLMSAFFGALTVLLIFLTIKHVTNSNLAASFGSLSLMASHAFWLHSVIAEVYTLNAFFLALLVYLALTKLRHKFFKYLFPIVFILGLLNHLVLLLSLPAFAFYMLMNISTKKRRIILMPTGILFALIILILIWLIIYQTSFIRGLLKSILIGYPALIPYILPPENLSSFNRETVFYFLYLFYQYPIFGVLIGGIGLFQFLKKDKPTALFLLFIMVFNGLFFIKTTYWQSFGGTKYTFYIPDYTIFSVFLGYGSLALFDRIRHLVGRSRIILGKIEANQLLSLSVILLSIALTISFYSFIPKAVSYWNIDLLNARPLPYRDNNSFFLNPNKHDYNMDRKFGHEILEFAKKDSVVFADFTVYTILKYLIEVENKRLDIILMRSEGEKLRKWVDYIKKNDPNTHIYIASYAEQMKPWYYNLEGIDEKYILRKVGSFFEIVKKESVT